MKTTIFHSFVLWMGVTAVGQEALSLDEAVRLALLNNPSIAKARQEIEASSGRLLLAGAIPSPELGFSWSEIPSDFNIAGFGERGIGASQVFEFPGKRRSRQRAARWDLQIRNEALRRSEMRVTAGVRRAFYTALLDLELVATAGEAMNLLRQFQRIAELRYESGSVPYLDILRVKMEMARMENRILDLKRNQSKGLSDLNRLLFLPDGVTYTLKENLTFQPFNQSLEETVSRLSSDRPSVKIAEAETERGRALASLARKSCLPDFSLGLTNLTLKERPPYNANNFYGTTVWNNWEFNLSVSIPIWFWRQQKGEITVARSTERIAEISRLEVGRNLTASIRNAYENVKTAEAQAVRFHQSLLKDREDALGTVQSLYQNGQMDILNLLDVYRTCLETRSEYVSTLHRYNVSLVDLEISGEESINLGEKNED
jgi:cobalt-zinc-cadmium efflux system outer membrane protein